VAALQQKKMRFRHVHTSPLLDHPAVQAHQQMQTSQQVIRQPLEA
jgi:hypothetical protein